MRAKFIAALLVLGLAGCGSSGGGDGPVVPVAPTGLLATPGNQQVTLSWTAVAGATSYNVYWSTTSGVTPSSGTKVAGAASPNAHAGLANGTQYYYVVTAVNTAGESGASSQASAIPATSPAPAAPTGVQATAGDQRVTVAWTSVTAATSYNLYWSTTTGVTPANGTKITGAANPYVHTGRTNGVPTFYVVTAVNANGESTPSGQVTATPSAAPFISMFVMSIQGGGIPPFGFLQQARICTDATCSTPISNATVTLNGGTPLVYSSTRHDYTGTQVIAAGASVAVHVGIGSTSYDVTATQFTSAPAITAPASGATWQASSANAISWTGGAPTTGASYILGVMDGSGDFVYPVRSGDSGGPKEVSTAITSDTVPASTIAAGSYSVMVGIGTTGLIGGTGGIPIAGTAAGSGLWMGIVAPLVPLTVQSAGAPPAPTGVQATAGNQQVNVAWNAVTGATSYNLYWSTTTGVTPANGTKIAGATSPYLHTGRTNGTPCYYVVTAVNANGESTPSAQVTATPSAAPFISMFVMSIQGGGIPPFGFLQQARVCTDSTCITPIPNATITINGGAPLTYDGARHQYTGTQVIAAGASVAIHVVIDSVPYDVTATQFTSAPTITAPTSGATWQGDVANGITWTGGGPTTGASYVLGIMSATGDFLYPIQGGNGGGPKEVAIGTTADTVPAGTLAGGSDAVMVGIGTTGMVGGTGGIAIAGTASGSGLWMGMIAPLVPITVQSSAAPSAPTGVQATAGNQQVSVGWNTVADATSYNVYWSTTSGVTPTNGTKVSGLATSPYVHAGLTNATPYYYVVTAQNGTGESSASSQVTATPTGSTAPYIYASVLAMGDGSTPPFGFSESVRVYASADHNDPISTATVTVNGNPVPWDAGQNEYRSTHVIAAGATVTLQVVVNSVTYTGTGTQYATAPTFTAPGSGATWQRTSDNTISWTGGSPTTGAIYVAGVMDGTGNFVFPARVPGAGGGPMEVGIGTTSVTVPANTITAAGPYAVMTGIGTRGIIDNLTGGIVIPDAAAGSGLWLGVITPLRPITVQ